MDVREVVALVLATRADRAARHAHRGAVHGLVDAERSGHVARIAQREMHALERHVFLARGFEQIAHHVFGRVRARAGDAEIRAATFDRHGHAVFDEPQIFVERAAEVREPRVVRRHEIEFAGGFDGSGCGHQLRPWVNKAPRRVRGVPE